MANINVNDLDGLYPTGADLFEDPESFMVELSDEYEQAQIVGGTGCVGTRCGAYTGCAITNRCQARPSVLPQ